MTIRLTCGDGAIVRLAREHFQKSVFNNPEVAAAATYTLQCKASSEIVNAVVDMVEGVCQTVTITEDNFEDLQNLCEELGFRGLDHELHTFKAGRAIALEERLDEYEEKLEDFETELMDVRDTLKDKVADHEFSLAELKEQIRKHEQLFQEVQRRLGEFESEKRKSEESRESVSRQVQSLERRLEEVARLCEGRNVEASRKTEQALREFPHECAKQRDLEEVAWNLTQLKENEKKTATKPAAIEQPATPAKTHPLLLPLSGNRRDLLYRSSKPLDGVIAHLTRECGGNVHDNGIVNVTASSCTGSAKNAVDLGTDTLYHSNNQKDTWICYDFKERRVIPTSYSVRSYKKGPGANNLKSWVIEVSNDGSSWTEIDRRDNNNDLNDMFATANFKISNVPSESFRFFRLRETGPNHRGDGTYYFVFITSLEIFGTLFEK